MLPYLKQQKKSNALPELIYNFPKQQQLEKPTKKKITGKYTIYQCISIPWYYITTKQTFVNNFFANALTFLEKIKTFMGKTNRTLFFRMDVFFMCVCVCRSSYILYYTELFQFVIMYLIKYLYIYKLNGDAKGKDKFLLVDFMIFQLPLI